MKINGKTIHQHLSVVNRHRTWLKRLIKTCGPKLRKAAKYWTLSEDSLTPNDANRITLLYNGKAMSRADYQKDVDKTGGIFETTFRDGQATVEFGRTVMTVVLASDFDVLDENPVLPLVNAVPVAAPEKVAA